MNVGEAAKDHDDHHQNEQLRGENERLRQENERLRESEQQLRESEQQLRALQANPYPLLLKTQDEVDLFVFIKTACERSTGRRDMHSPLLHDVSVCVVCFGMCLFCFGVCVCLCACVVVNLSRCPFLPYIECPSVSFPQQN